MSHQHQAMEPPPLRFQDRGRRFLGTYLEMLLELERTQKLDGATLKSSRVTLVNTLRV
jgi:hypothetical protein